MGGTTGMAPFFDHVRSITGKGPQASQYTPPNQAYMPPQQQMNPAFMANSYFPFNAGGSVDPVRLARQVMQERAKGGGVKRLLIDQYPTQYLPEVGRQVMAQGGMPDDVMIDDQQGEDHPAWIPQRLIAEKAGRKRDPNDRPKVDMDTLRMTPKLYQKQADIIRGYRNVPEMMANTSHDDVMEHFIEHVKQNLLTLHDAVPEDIRSRSKKWYEGGRKISDDWSEKYNVPNYSVAGAIAALSPQTDWYANVSRAERVLDALKGNGQLAIKPHGLEDFYSQFRFSPEMDARFKSVDEKGNPYSLNKPDYLPVYNMLAGKSLSDIDKFDLPPKEKAVAKAMWIRLYDEAHNSPEHRIITPEGDFDDHVLTKDGSRKGAGWGSLVEISKAIRAVEAVDPSEMSELMGEKHKVRNFYNNIISPNSMHGDVTMDTHAIAAGLLRPLSGKSTEVAHNLDTSPPKGTPGAGGSDVTGIRGTYPVFAEAYRRAAKERGLLPREMQSITWEAVRSLFPDTFKRGKSSGMVDKAWDEYRAGNIDRDGAVRRVFEIAGATNGLKPPSWFKEGSSGQLNEPPQGSGDAGELYRSEPYGSAPEGVERRARGGAAGAFEEEHGNEAQIDGDRYEKSQEGPFYRLARKSGEGASGILRGVRSGTREADPAFGGGSGESGVGGSELPAQGQASGVGSVPEAIAKEYLQRIHGRELVAPNLTSSLAKQSAIGRTFAAGVEGSPEYKREIFDAYARAMPDVIEQSGATNYDELLERSYRQMAKETAQQFETLPFRMSFHRAGEGDYASSKHMLDDLHNNGHLYVFQGGEPHEFLHNVDPETGLNENEKFRAVHDVFGHGIYGNPFGPKGEENAWAVHSQMYSPLARLAMTAETRGQNSFVNYTPINAKLKEMLSEVESRLADARRNKNEFGIELLEKKKKDLYKNFQFAPQKALLLPPEYLDPAYQGGMPDYVRNIIKPEPGTGFASALTHYSNDPNMQETDPSRYGTGIPGDEASRLRSRPGAVQDRSYFYLGEPGEVPPEEGLGPHRYRAEAQNLYDITKDPMGFKTLARESNRMPWTSNFNPGTVDPGQFANDIERLAKEYGYQGFANPNAAFPMAVTFDPMKVERRATGGAAVDEAIRVINKSGSSPRDAVTLSKRLLGRQ